MFTNIPPDEIIDICVVVCITILRVTLISLRMFFHHLFNVVTKLYEQIDVVAMVSPLGPGLANIFMYGFENKRLNDCHHGLKPVL